MSRKWSGDPRGPTLDCGPVGLPTTTPGRDPMDDAARLRLAVTRACDGLVDREVLAEVVALCAVAGEHVLVIGPPGTGKSQVVRGIAGQLGGRYFEYLLGRFTEPS